MLSLAIFTVVLTAVVPVILRREDYSRCLEPSDPARLPVDLLRPYDADGMKAWKVGALVGNVRNNDPECVAPL
jgi:putative SOS response-associated peptidase YedK